MNKVKLGAAFILALMCLVVILQNTDAVETRFLFATVTMPRALLLFVTALAGFALGILTSFLWTRDSISGSS